MKLRVFAAGLCAVLAFGGQSLLGRQAASAPASSGPFDSLY